MQDIKCPDCKSKSFIKKGRRKRSYRVVQLYRCKVCGKTFTASTFQNKMYPARIVFDAINYYYLGHTLDETRKKINKQYKLKTGKTTIYSWLKTYKELTPISSVRKNFGYFDKILFTKQFEHENLDYEFMYHKYKLDVLVRKPFPNLTKYLLRFKKGCPDEFFEIGERCSQPKFSINIKSHKSSNLACKMALFAVNAKKNNRERHYLVEKFMIVNDKATIACEVPIWYWEKSIDSGVTGHIDILQVRRGNVFILDYKPGAAKDKKAAQQLYHYAVALSFRAKVPFEKIRCAWFDEDVYFEYSPSEADVKLIKAK